MSLYVAISIWLIANIIMAFWLFSTSSGWHVAKCLPYGKRLRLIYFGERNTDLKGIENIAIIRKFIWRSRVYFYLFFLIPLIIFYGALYVVYTT